MAQYIYCRTCNASYAAELRGKSCPVCGEELIHARIPASQTTRRRAAPTGVGRAKWDSMLKRDPCSYCGERHKPKDITIDHIQPKALGGSKGSWTNRTASCQPCNGRKAHTPLLFFLLEENKGMDLSHFKDEDGNWPIPEAPAICQEERVRVEEEHGQLAHMDPRKLLARVTSL